MVFLGLDLSPLKWMGVGANPQEARLEMITAVKLFL